MILPLNVSQERMMALFRVQFEVIFTLEHGIQKIIHFSNSKDLKDTAMFLYCSSTDKIIKKSIKFDSFMNTNQRKITNDTMTF
jgi:hypothetical protein